MNEKEYKLALELIEVLMLRDPEPGEYDGQVLGLLADLATRYENKHPKVLKRNKK